MGSGAYNFKPMMNELKAAMKPMVKNALIQGGGILGGMTGIPSGRNFGSQLGQRISRLIGSGDYEMNSVTTNSLIHPRGADPSASFGKDGVSIRMKYREFLGDVSTGTVAGAFTNYTYPINPGLRSTFPYLSQLANNFDLYCVKGIVFEYISSASPYLATSALGTVIASTEPNSEAPAYTSKFQMENSACSISTRIDKNLMYGIECALGSNPQNCYYVRSGASTLPLTTTDIGNFQIAVAPGTGVPTSTVVGELWVTYDIELSRPSINLSRVGSLQYYGTTAVTATPVGTVSTLNSSGALSGVTTTTTALSFPGMVVGDVLLVSFLWFGGTAAAGHLAPTFTLSGFQVPSAIPGVGSYGSTPQNGVLTNTSCDTEFYVQCTTSGTCTITPVAPGIPTGATKVAILAAMVGNYALTDISF